MLSSWRNFIYCWIFSILCNMDSIILLDLSTCMLHVICYWCSFSIEQWISKFFIVLAETHVSPFSRIYLMCAKDLKKNLSMVFHFFNLSSMDDYPITNIFSSYEREREVGSVVQITIDSCFIYCQLVSVKFIYV